MNAKVIDAALPGHPSRRLVKNVRSHLKLYGIVPKRDQWLLTWEWARNIAVSYSKTMWPIASEIGAQYTLLLLAEMRQFHQLKLPYRATHPGVLLPERVRELVATGQLALPSPEVEG